MTVISFRHTGDRDRAIDFDLYVDLLVTHSGFTRRDAEIEVRREARRDNLMICRSDPANGYKSLGPESSLSTPGLTP